MSFMRHFKDLFVRTFYFFSLTPNLSKSGALGCRPTRPTIQKHFFFDELEMRLKNLLFLQTGPLRLLRKCFVFSLPPHAWKSMNHMWIEYFQMSAQHFCAIGFFLHINENFHNHYSPGSVCEQSNVQLQSVVLNPISFIGEKFSLLSLSQQTTF